MPKRLARRSKRTRTCGFDSRTSQPSSPTGAGSRSSWSRLPERLGLGLDALVFADDNPAECAEVAAALPEVETLALDVPSSELVRTFAANLRFEIPALTVEDVVRRSSYDGRASAEALRTSADSLDDFWRSLEMHARVRDVDEGSIERAAQLTQKTNQFNLTLGAAQFEEVRQLVADPSSICKTLELEDRFAQHGIVGLVFAVPSAEDPSSLMLDTLLLSCRVIGRTAEAHLLSHISRIALGLGFVRLRGFFVQGQRNALVADLFPRLGFRPVPGHEAVWDYDLATCGPLQSDHIDDKR